MGKAFSFDGEEYSRITPAPRSLKRPGAGPRVARRGKQHPAPVQVPMLDWPSDLFSDNASLAELVRVDFLLQCDPPCVPHARQSLEFYTQIAA